MNGRMETKIKIESEIVEKLKEEGDKILTQFYYAIDTAGMEHKSKRLYIKYVLDFKRFAGKELVDATSIDIMEYIRSKKTKDKPQQSLRTIWYALNKLYSYLETTGDVSESPMKAVPLPKKHNHKDVKRVVLKEEEYHEIIRNLMTKAKVRDIAIILLLMNTGMRCSALTEINISDVDFKEKTIRVTDKRNKTMDFVISDDVISAIEVWLEKRGHKETEALFVSGNHRISYLSVYEVVKKWCSVNGKTISPHKLRGSYATILYNQTKDIRFVQECMHHADFSTTMLYIQTDDKVSMSKANQIMSGLTKCSKE